MTLHRIVLLSACGCCCVAAMCRQIDIPRIEQMSVDTDAPIRDWKQVARDYDSFVYDTDSEGDYLPLVHTGNAGTNYPEIEQFYLDTYVGSFSAGSQAEAINILPSLVGATLVGIDKSNDRDTDWVAMSQNFFNRRNGQMVYLNGYSAASGNDWWYDVMPNIYFYQLYTLYPHNSYAYWDEQFASVASQWANAVTLLGADIFNWQAPSINYRAFNLATGKPLASGVPEPEAAGALAWLLYKAYLVTGEVSYMQRAQLCLEALCTFPSNPSYELQLAYATQAAACMNAREGCDFYIDRLLNWCFDRGPLRGWGSIVGNWGGYNVSGLIGEANDGGNDYAFVMNGFQQGAALAPVAKYDKRYARAIARWISCIAGSSRLFYRSGLPENAQEAVSSRWLHTYDNAACLPFESMKERYDNHSPYAMGDAIKGGWAATNISLYSGSSVGYLAAVTDSTDVPGICRIDVNATDFFVRDALPQYLYYNPYTDERTVSLPLPAGKYDLYDSLSDEYIARDASSSASITLAADEARLVTLIPAGSQLTVQGNTLCAGNHVIDYNYLYNYDKTMHVNALATDKSIVEPGESVTARLHVRNIPTGASVVCEWTADGKPLTGTNTAPTAQWTAPDTPGIYTIAVRATAHGESVSDSIQVEVVREKYDGAQITDLASSASMPATPASQIDVTASVAEWRDDLSFDWDVDGGSIVAGDSSQVTWQLPALEGTYTITCTAANRFGSDSRSLTVLVRSGEAAQAPAPLIYYPLNGNTLNAAASSLNAISSGGTFVADSRGNSNEAFDFTSTDVKLYTPSSPEIDFDDAITLSCWFLIDSKLPREQFLISHGSWEERYKLSITPEMKLRWTVNSTGGTIDVDSKETIEVGKFYHATVVYTGFSSEVYLNGAFSNFAAQQGYMNATEQDLCFGAKATDNTEYSLIGIMDEIRVYNTALTPGEIAALPNEWDLSAITSPVAQRLRWHRSDDKIYVTLPALTNIAAARLYDAKGCVLPCRIMSQAAEAVIHIGRLPQGIYLLQLTDGKGDNHILKLVE